MSYHQPSHIIPRVASPTLLQTQLACLGISGDVAAREDGNQNLKYAISVTSSPWRVNGCQPATVRHNSLKVLEKMELKCRIHAVSRHPSTTPARDDGTPKAWRGSQLSGPMEWP